MGKARDKDEFDLAERTARFGEAGSKKEFKYRISVCCRESRETKYHLRMFVAAVPEKAEPARVLWKEADELNRIFATIFRNTADK
jgi:hypothetical protein